jgi:predicted hydrocarbon binding protein
MFKRLRKDKSDVGIDEEKGHVFLGDKKKDIKLLMLRPIDILEFCEFAGANADDIVIWAGKTIGKEIMQKYFYDKNWTGVGIDVKKDVFLGVLEGLMLMGYGYLTSTFKNDHIFVSVYNPLAQEEQDNIMAKNLCLMNQGIIGGILEVLGFETEGEEVECVLLDDQRCRFKFTLFETEVPKELIDEDKKPEAISGFLESL